MKLFKSLLAALALVLISKATFAQECYIKLTCKEIHKSLPGTGGDESDPAYREYINYDVYGYTLRAVANVDGKKVIKYIETWKARGPSAGGDYAELLEYAKKSAEKAKINCQNKLEDMLDTADFCVSSGPYRDME